MLAFAPMGTLMLVMEASRHLLLNLQHTLMSATSAPGACSVKLALKPSEMRYFCIESTCWLGIEYADSSTLMLLK